MASSGSYDFTQTRDQIITDALTALGVVRPGGTVGTNDLNYCSNQLNKIIKAWEGQGIHMWKETEGTVFLRTGVNTYTLSSSSTDQAGDNVVETYLTAAASGTTLTVTSTTGMTAADNIGIELDDGTRQWTTIVSVDSTTSLTLTASISSAAASGNTVFTYTTHITLPLYISSARFRDSNGTDRPIFIRGRDEFMQIPDKTNTGKMNQIFYAPGISSGLLYVWPTPDTVDDRLKISYMKQIEDFDSGSNTADFPTEWLDCITLNLMHRVAKTYSKDEKDRQQIKEDAAEALMQMQLWDTDSGSSRIVPNYRDE